MYDEIEGIGFMSYLNDYQGEDDSDDDLIFNPSVRIPICLCVDTSGSMNQKDAVGIKRVERLKNGLHKFLNEIASDVMTVNSAEICILGFKYEPYVIRDFKTLGADEPDFDIRADGGGDIGLAVKRALELLDERKKKYKSVGIEYYQPWLVIMSDGHSTGSNRRDVNNALVYAQKEVIERENNRKITVLPVYIGGDIDKDEKARHHLQGFSNKNPMILIDTARFGRFFSWLGKSVSVYSGAEDFVLDVSALDDWGDI